MTIDEAREKAERVTGRKLDDSTFFDVLRYTRHKAAMTGHGEDYVPLLLLDEIKNEVFRSALNELSRQQQMAKKELIDLLDGGKSKCAMYA